jgi:hypothetical protein
VLNDVLVPAHVASQRRLPKTEVNANAQYAARVSLANKILEMRTAMFMTKGDQATLKDEVLKVQAKLEPKVTILADLKKKAVKLATELKSKDPSAEVDPQTAAAKKRAVPLPTFQLPGPEKASGTLNAQDVYTSSRREALSSASSTSP